MIVRFHSMKKEGLYLRGLFRNVVRRSVAFGEIVTAERLPSRIGFRLHGRGWTKLVVIVSRSGLRAFEGQLRSGEVVVVDQWGARIDESQFAKEEDPDFNRNLDTEMPGLIRTVLTPNFVLRWRSRRAMRQWSDDATGD
jgi:hypothetical protein